MCRGDTTLEMVFLLQTTTALLLHAFSNYQGSPPPCTGVGQVVLQVAAAVGCKCIGIEKADIPARYSEVGVL